VHSGAHALVRDVHYRDADRLRRLHQRRAALGIAEYREVGRPHGSPTSAAPAARSMRANMVGPPSFTSASSLFIVAKAPADRDITMSSPGGSFSRKQLAGRRG
jgi:hypothetical protein